jgi:HSP20 family protein
MANVSLYDPFADAAISDIFRGFFRPVRVADAPGARKEDIQVAIEGNQVTVSAEIKRETERTNGDHMLRSERYYGNVYRSFTLPADLDEGTSTAKFENGVLELTLAKKPAVAGRRITIQ